MTKAKKEIPYMDNRRVEDIIKQQNEKSHTENAKILKKAKELLTKKKPKGNS